MANVVEIVLKGTDKLTAPFTTAIKSVNDLQKAASVMATAFVGMGVTAAGALSGLAFSAIKSAAEMGKLAQTAGMPVESFSKLAAAAKLGEVPLESLAQNLRKLNVNLAEAAGDSSSKAAQAFAAIGVAVTDASGKIRPQAEIIKDVADKFAGYKDGAEKAALAVAMFGKSGADMIPLLNEGGAAIQDTMDAASGTTKEAAEQAHEFENNLIKLKTTFTAVGKGIAYEILPTFVELTGAFVKFIKDNGIVQAVVMTTADAMKWLASIGYGAYKALSMLAEILGGLLAQAINIISSEVKMVSDLFTVWGRGVVELSKSLYNLVKIAGEVGTVLGYLSAGDFTAAWTASKSAVKDFGGELGKIGDTFTAIFADSKKAIVTNFSEGWETAKGITHNTIEAIKKDTQDLASFTESLWKPKSLKLSSEVDKPSAPIVSTENDKAQREMRDREMRDLLRLRDLTLQMQDAQLSGQAKIEAEAYRAYEKRLEQIGQLNIDEQASLDASLLARQEYEQKITQIEADAMEQRRQLTEDLQVAAMDSQFANEQAAAQRRLENENKRIAQSNFSEEESLRLSGLARVKFDNDMQKARISIASQTAGNLANIALAFGKKGAAAYKVFASTQAVIDTYAAANAAYRAMAGIPFIGPALGIAAAAAAIASGVANVAKINGVGGQAHAGLDFVPSESTFLLQRGERVIQPTANEDLTNFLRNQRGESNSQPSVIQLVLDGDIIGRVLGRLSDDGRLTINERAIVTA